MAIGACGLQDRPLLEQPVGQQPAENVLDEPDVTRVVGPAIVVIGKAKAAEHVGKRRVVPASQRSRIGFLPFGPDGDGRTVAVGARDIEHRTAVLAVVTRQDIARQQCRDLADVQLAVGVWPGPSDKNRLHDLRLPNLDGGCKKPAACFCLQETG